MIGKQDNRFINEQELEEPEKLPLGPLAGENPRTAPEEGTLDDFGFVLGKPPDSDGEGAGVKDKSGTTVGGAISCGNCCVPARQIMYGKNKGN